jgi:predicted nucleic acid-binding protein
MLLADSTILIDLSRGNEAAILFCDNQRRKGEGMALSIISSMELIIGCRDKGDLDRTLPFFKNQINHKNQTNLSHEMRSLFHWD